MGSRVDGYGRINIGGRPIKAHRDYYVRFIGYIPENYIVHHTCERKACVNPKHLIAMTRAEHRRLHR